jgi:hypothetical protein
VVVGTELLELGSLLIEDGELLEDGGLLELGSVLLELEDGDELVVVGTELLELGSVLLEDGELLEVWDVLVEEDVGAGGSMDELEAADELETTDELEATDADEEVEVPAVLSPDVVSFLYMSSLSPAPQYSY